MLLLESRSQEVSNSPLPPLKDNPMLEVRSLVPDPETRLMVPQTTRSDEMKIGDAGKDPTHISGEAIAVKSPVAPDMQAWGPSAIPNRQLSPFSLRKFWPEIVTLPPPVPGIAVGKTLISLGIS